METIFKSVVAVIGAIITFLLGGWSPLLQVLVIFIVMDYVLGFLVAA
ncbi:holin, partial [Siminovitchia terrae]